MLHRTLDLDGEVHYVDFGGEGRPVVLVHGLGGSYANWLSVGPGLTEHGHVFALDLSGHGRTRSQGRGARVSANRRLLGRFLEAVAREPAVVVGNSMGGYLALEEAATEPEKVHSLVLVDPAVPIVRGALFDLEVSALFAALTLPLVGRALLRFRARRGPEEIVHDLLALCCVEPSRIDPAVYSAHLALARERFLRAAEGRRDFLEAQRSLMGRLLRRRRFYSMVARVRAKALIVEGERDRLVRVEAVRALAAARPDFTLVVLADVGHVPQLEAPARFLAAVRPFLAGRAVA